MGYMVSLVFCLVRYIRCCLSNCPFDCFRVITRQSLIRKRVITVAEMYTCLMSVKRAKSMIHSSHKSHSFALLNEKQHRSKFKPQKQQNGLTRTCPELFLKLVYPFSRNLSETLALFVWNYTRVNYQMALHLIHRTLYILPCLQVRLLTGVGRFNEMSYIFDTLFEHEHFELLCRRGIDKVTTE